MATKTTTGTKKTTAAKPKTTAKRTSTKKEVSNVVEVAPVETPVEETVQSEFYYRLSFWVTLKHTRTAMVGSKGFFGKIVAEEKSIDEVKNLMFQVLVSLPSPIISTENISNLEASAVDQLKEMKELTNPEEGITCEVMAASLVGTVQLFVKPTELNEPEMPEEIEKVTGEVE